MIREFILQFFYFQILAPVCIYFFIEDPIAIITIFVIMAGFFDGNADAIAFRFDSVIWRKILKGRLLNWFDGKYYNHLNKWYIHPIFRDGWHFFKNGTIFSFLLAIFIAMFYLSDFKSATGLFIVNAFVFSIYHELWFKTINNDKKSTIELHPILRGEYAKSRKMES